MIKNKEYFFTKNEVVGIIPARGGSKGVPRKNIRLLSGYPLIAYSIAACKLSNEITRVIISTDDEEIAEISRQFGGEVPFMRPKEMATDKSGDIDFVLHAINWLQDNEGAVPEYLAHIRPTTPLRVPHILDEAIIKLKLHDEGTSLRSAHVAPESPMKWFVKGDGDTFLPFAEGLSSDEANNGRENFVQVYIPDGYIDVLKPETIVNTGLLHGKNMLSYTSPFCTEVDTEYELEMLDFELRYRGSVLFDYLESNYSKYRREE